MTDRIAELREKLAGTSSEEARSRLQIELDRLLAEQSIVAWANANLNPPD